MAAASQTSGGDLLFESGQDVSIGHSHHDEERVSLYFEESVTFRVSALRGASVLKR